MVPCGLCALDIYYYGQRKRNLTGYSLTVMLWWPRGSSQPHRICLHFTFPLILDLPNWLTDWMDSKLIFLRKHSYRYSNAKWRNAYEFWTTKYSQIMTIYQHRCRKRMDSKFTYTFRVKCQRRWQSFCWYWHVTVWCVPFLMADWIRTMYVLCLCICDDPFSICMKSDAPQLRDQRSIDHFHEFILCKWVNGSDSMGEKMLKISLFPQTSRY